VAKIGAVAPLQIGAIVAKPGVIFGFNVIVILVGTTQMPDVGVNVYTLVVVLSTVAGFQVPVIPLIEVVGSIGGTAPLQIEVAIVNVGVIIGFTVTVIVGEVAHCPVLGTKV
jgi:hypothetical protein